MSFGGIRILNKVLNDNKNWCSNSSVRKPAPYRRIILKVKRLQTDSMTWKILFQKTHGNTFRCYSRSPLHLSFSCTLHGHIQTDLGHWRTWYRDICWMLEGVSFIYRQILNMLQSTEMRDYTLGNAEGVGGSLHELLHTLEPPLVSSLCLKQVQVSVSNGCDDKLMLASFISIRSAGKNAQLVVWPAVDGNSVWLQYWGGGDSVVQETSLLCTLDLVRNWIFPIEFQNFTMQLETRWAMDTCIPRRRSVQRSSAFRGGKTPAQVEGSVRWISSSMHPLSTNAWVYAYQFGSTIRWKW